MKNTKCKICRRAGVKLFLKSERCLSPKCSIIRKPYPPGEKRKKRIRSLSEYGKELKEKQKLQNWYNLRERQFRRYIKDALKARGKVEDAGILLIEVLESRLDNVIFRLGLASSRSQARQLISHRHFLVNDKPINIPSYLVKKGDKIKIKPASLKKGIFQNLAAVLKKHTPPSWLRLDPKNLEAKVVGKPSLEEAAPPTEISPIFEYYSR
jgi:small subunit ribosomal protein S4